MFIPIGCDWWGEWSGWDGSFVASLAPDDDARPCLLIYGPGESYPWPPADYRQLMNPPMN